MYNIDMNGVLRLSVENMETMKETQEYAKE